MTTKTETRHAGEFIVSEGNGTISRKAVTLASGNNLGAGAVLGIIDVDTSSITVAADGGNTGDGALTKASPAFAAGIKDGVYRATCIEPASNGGSFSVEDPDGIEIGIAEVGTAFDGVVKFTIADGAADFIAGDVFTLTVAAGSGKYAEYDPTNGDGSQTAVAILFDAVDASSADKAAVAIVRDAEVNKAELAWFTGASSGQITTGLAELELKGIVGL